MQDDKCRAPAEQVDHVMRLAEGGDQRDWDLLQSLCQPHHDAKTRRGRKAREDPSAMTEQHRGQRSLRPLPLLTLPLKQHDDAQDADDELGGSEAHRADEDDDVDPPGIAEPAVEPDDGSDERPDAHVQRGQDDRPDQSEHQMGPRADEGADIHQPKQLVRNKIVIAGNYANNFQYAPEWLWEKNLTPTEFMTYMALRYFSYPAGPTVAMLVDKTGFDTAVIEETLHSLLERELVEPCVEDEFGQPADDRWRFCYYKYVKDAPDQAPVPVPDDSDPEYHLKQFQARMARSKEAFYAANPGAKEAEERRALDEAEWHAAERRQFEEQRKKLDDPNYRRSGGPINPDINGMVDTVKHLGWSALAQIAGIQYHLAELTGLALLDPDANDTLQNELHHLAEAVEWGAIRGVLDYTEIEAHDYLYEEEFWNTFTDGREIAIRIMVEEERDVGAPILESPATIEFPHGTIYHINPVTPKPEGK